MNSTTATKIRCEKHKHRVNLNNAAASMECKHDYYLVDNLRQFRAEYMYKTNKRSGA